MKLLRIISTKSNMSFCFIVLISFQTAYTFYGRIPVICKCNIEAFMPIKFYSQNILELEIMNEMTKRIQTEFLNATVSM